MARSIATLKHPVLPLESEQLQQFCTAVIVKYI